MFQDRHDAAVQLARQLMAYQGQHPLVLGVARGGVPMAHDIAVALHGDLDVLVARKIAHPLLPEYAIGAVDESGWTYYSPFADTVMRNPADLDVEKLRQLDVIRRFTDMRTNPGETVLTPFMGVGSEVYGAVCAGRNKSAVATAPTIQAVRAWRRLRSA